MINRLAYDIGFVGEASGAGPLTMNDCFEKPIFLAD